MIDCCSLKQSNTSCDKEWKSMTPLFPIQKHIKLTIEYTLNFLIQISDFICEKCQQQNKRK